MTAADVLVLAEGVGCCKLGPEYVLLDASGELLRGINADGGRVLALLDGKLSVGEISSALGADVSAFIAQLCERGLVVRATASVTPAVAAAAMSAVVAPELLWEQRFVGLQALSDPCNQNPPPGFCAGASRFGDFGGGAQGP